MPVPAGAIPRAAAAPELSYHCDRPIRVVYIGGWLRSGSTLLCQSLGCFPGAVALGEVAGIWGAAARGEPCSCGRRVTDCEVWSHALACVKTTCAKNASYSELSDLAARVLRTRHASRLGHLDACQKGAWPADVRRYVTVLGTLLKGVAEVTGAYTLIDSSKLPPGFLTTRLSPAVTVDLVHILRDPRAVANSERKSQLALRRGSELPAPPKRSAAKSAIYWSGFNLTLRWYARYARSYAILDYEDLVNRPRECLTALADHLGLPDSDASLRDGIVHPGHLAVGNPSRFSSPSDGYRGADLSWRTELPLHERVIVTLATLGINRCLKSSLRPRVGP